MFGSFKKIQNVQISLADILTLIFEAEKHGSTLSTSFHFPVTYKFKADDTGTHIKFRSEWKNTSS